MGRSREAHCCYPEKNEAEEDGGEEEMVVEEEEEEEDSACWAFYGWRDGVRRFPPVIPLLARTGNLWGHMPWMLKRTYKEDGSLVIQEVMVEHHEFFRARREKGRLTLKLVEMDQTSRSLPICQERIEEQAKEAPAEAEPPQLASPPSPLPSESSLSEGAEEKAQGLPDGTESEAAITLRLTELTLGGVGKGCFGNGQPSSMLQMPMPAMRPVHS